jgi:transcriptional regulator with XRE-family HTH domain
VVEGWLIVARSESTAPEFAAKLNLLFDKVRHPSGRTFFDAELAKGAGVAPRYVGQMRKGERPRPSFDTVGAIAAWFGVRVDYFLADGPPEKFLVVNDDEQVVNDRQAALAAALEDPHLSQLVLRAQGSSRGLVKSLLDIVNHAQEADRVLAERPSEDEKRDARG